MKNLTLYIDSNILIYLAQPHSEFHKSAWNIIDLAEKQGHQLLISSVGYAEYAVFKQRDDIEIGLDELFESGQYTEVPFGHNEAVTFADLRETFGKKLPPVDAIHAATALAHKADFLITNDTPFSKLPIPGLKLLHLSHFTKPTTHLLLR